MCLEQPYLMAARLPSVQLIPQTLFRILRMKKPKHETSSVSTNHGESFIIMNLVTYSTVVSEFQRRVHGIFINPKLKHR